MAYLRSSVALALIAVLFWAFSLPLTAQDRGQEEGGDAGGGSAEVQPDEDADGEEKEEKEEEEEKEIKPGAESPRKAAEKFLAAAKERNFRQFIAMINPSIRESLEEHGIGEGLMKALSLKSFEVKEETIDEDDANGATVTYKWEATFDLDTLVTAVLDLQRAEMRGLGMTDDEIDMQMEVLRPIFQEVLREVKVHFERESQRMTLVKNDDRWYVHEPLELPEDVRRMFFD